MKKILSLFAGISVCASALANIPTYRTFSGYGNATLPATVIMPADPNSQIRIVSMFYSSDNAAGTLNLFSGTTAYYLTFTNAATSTTNFINSTNGLSTGTVVILQQAGADYTNTITSFNNTGTNTIPAGTLTNTVNGPTGLAGTQATNVNYIVTSGSGFNVNGLVGNDVYLAGATTSIPLGAQTNALNGDAIFTGNYGRPVFAQLTPATATNRLSSISAHYDSASQP